MMEKCEEYQYKNSLNIFSITLGPFETVNKGEIRLDDDQLGGEKKEVATGIRKEDGAGAFGGIEKINDPNRKFIDGGKESKVDSDESGS